MTTQLEQAWELAKQRFAAVGIDVEEALRQLDRLPVSMHCWQGDDVAGFENPEGSLTGGIQSTGNYPGKARNATELRADLEQALRLIPGPKRLNLHAIYLESDTPVARDQIKPEHFKNWVEWAKANRLGLDFNPTCFSHPLSADGFTLSHPDAKIRQFWIDHCKASRRVSAYFGEQLGTPSVMNIWIPDGMKDITVDRLAPRQRLLEPTDQLRQLEASGDYTARLALLEEQKSLPWQAVWEMYCQRHDTPAGSQWLDSVRVYEKEILSKRS
ncbi:rhamnose isomerase [Salmonella enterica subsp. enterica serovar Braenderup]|nr:rhamnose isomerase [Salmonella enterica subsp. enterica serovar Braenderup]